MTQDPICDMTKHQQAETPQPGTEAKPAAQAKWRSPTMLTPEEIEDLRQDSERVALKIRAILAARRAKL